jgi:hypothetical protein
MQTQLRGCPCSSYTSETQNIEAEMRSLESRNESNEHNSVVSEP